MERRVEEGEGEGLWHASKEQRRLGVLLKTGRTTTFVLSLLESLIHNFTQIGYASMNSAALVACDDLVRMFLVLI